MDADLPAAPSPPDPDDRTRGLLERHGIVPTAQRVVIASLMFERNQHLTAEQVIAALLAKGERVSKATVYNTLNLFAEKGLIRPLNLDPTRCSFDSNIAPHFHVHAVDTGELIDVAPEAIEFAKLPELPPGTELLGVEVVLKVRHKV
jgi:Fur family transcriptional regulator, iron response regulator